MNMIKEHFSVGVDLYEVVEASQCHKPSSPPPPHNMQNGVGVPPWLFDNI
jgi:hypothetical protein